MGGAPPKNTAGIAETEHGATTNGKNKGRANWLQFSDDPLARLSRPRKANHSCAKGRHQFGQAHPNPCLGRHGGGGQGLISIKGRLEQGRPQLSRAALPLTGRAKHAEPIEQFPELNVGRFARWFRPGCPANDLVKLSQARNIGDQYCAQDGQGRSNSTDFHVLSQLGKNSAGPPRGQTDRHCPTSQSVFNR
jgi:hypothetical protein